jgi:hypothetical protein
MKLRKAAFGISNNNCVGRKTSGSGGNIVGLDDFLVIFRHGGYVFWSQKRRDCFVQ